MALEPAVAVHETLVLAALSRNVFVRLADPERPAPLPSESTIILQTIPERLRRIVDAQGAAWTFAKFVRARLQQHQDPVDAIQVRRRPIPLDEFDPGLVIVVHHIPRDCQPPFEKLAWPYWKMTPSKLKWWLDRRPVGNWDAAARVVARYH